MSEAEAGEAVALIRRGLSARNHNYTEKPCPTCGCNMRSKFAVGIVWCGNCGSLEDGASKYLGGRVEEPRERREVARREAKIATAAEALSQLHKAIDSFRGELGWEDERDDDY